MEVTLNLIDNKSKHAISFDAKQLTPKKSSFFGVLSFEQRVAIEETKGNMHTVPNKIIQLFNDHMNKTMKINTQKQREAIARLSKVHFTR